MGIGVAVTDDSEDTDREIDSGPFCRHWGDPSDCEELCACGHTCAQHGRGERSDCYEDGCDCAAFVEADEP